MKFFTKSLLAVVACSAGILTSPLFAGPIPCDGTCGNRALTGNPIVTLQHQERETPTVNNITQVTNAAMTGAYISSAGNGGWSITDAYASCGGGAVVSGGVSCGSNSVVLVSEPSGNGWYGVCSRTAGNENGPTTIQTTAVCVPG